MEVVCELSAVLICERKVAAYSATDCLESGELTKHYRIGNEIFGGAKKWLRQAHPAFPYRVASQQLARHSGRAHRFGTAGS
jgi:hypothetical protein